MRLLLHALAVCTLFSPLTPSPVPPTISPLPFDVSFCFPLSNDGVCDLRCYYPTLEQSDCRNIETIDQYFSMDLPESCNIVEFTLWYGIEFNIRMALNASVELIKVNETKVYDADPLKAYSFSCTASFKVTSKKENPVELVDLQSLSYSTSNLSPLIRRDDAPPSSSPASSSPAVPLVAVLIIVGVVCGVAYQTIDRTRKRRMVSVQQTWQIPKEDGLLTAHASIGTPKRPRLIDDSTEMQPPLRKAFVNITNTNGQINIGNTPRSQMDRFDIRYLNTPQLKEFGTLQRPVATPTKPVRRFQSNELHLVAGSASTIDETVLIERARRLLEQKKCGLEDKDEGERTALLKSVSSGRVQLASFLIQNGSDVTAMDRSDQTVLHHAVHTTNYKMLKMLLGHKDVVNKVVDSRRSIDAIDNRDRTALMLCSLYPWMLSRPLAEALVKAGADYNTPGDRSSNYHDGRTALHHAASANNIEMIKWLVKLPKIELDAQDLQGCTAIAVATFNGNCKAVKLLLDAGASGTIADTLDHYPLDIAERKGFRDIYALLARHRDNKIFNKETSIFSRKKRRSDQGPSRPVAAPVKRRCSDNYRPSSPSTMSPSGCFTSGALPIHQQQISSDSLIPNLSHSSFQTVASNPQNEPTYADVPPTTYAMPMTPSQNNQVQPDPLFGSLEPLIGFEQNLNNCDY